MNINFNLNWSELIVGLLVFIPSIWALIKANRVERNQVDVKASSRNVEGWTKLVDNMQETINLQKNDMMQMRDHHHKDVMGLRKELADLRREHQECLLRDSQKEVEIASLKIEMEKLKNKSP